MSVLLAAAWAGLVGLAGARARPPSRAMPRRGRAGSSPLGRVGRWTQGRVPALSSLAAPVAGAGGLGVAVLVAVNPIVAGAAAAALVATALVTGAAQRARRLRQIVVAAPAGWELLRLAVGGGLALPEAVREVGRHLDGPFGALLVEVDTRVRRGQEFAAALESVAVPVGEVVAQPFGVLAAAHRSGAPVAPALARAASRQRAGHRRAAEARARRLPVLLLLPLVCCVLPSFALLTVVPMLAGGLSDLSVP